MNVLTYVHTYVGTSQHKQDQHTHTSIVLLSTTRMLGVSSSEICLLSRQMRESQSLVVRIPGLHKGNSGQLLNTYVHMYILLRSGKLFAHSYYLYHEFRIFCYQIYTQTHMHTYTHYIHAHQCTHNHTITYP